MFPGGGEECLPLPLPLPQSPSATTVFGFDGIGSGVVGDVEGWLRAEEAEEEVAEAETAVAVALAAAARLEAEDVREGELEDEFSM